MYRAGACCRDGRGVEKDARAAAAWFQRGVAAHDADCLNAVGCAHEAGTAVGFPRDYGGGCTS
jgi:TPR repeat protein